MNDLLIKRVLKELPYNERLMLYRILHTDVPDTINHVIEKSILEYGLNLGKESVISGKNSAYITETTCP